MARPRLLPGERELVRLRPAPAAWLGRYLLAALWPAWGSALAWAPGLSGLALPTRMLLAFGVPLVVASVVYLPGRAYMRLVLAVLTAAGVALTGLADYDDPDRAATVMAGTAALAGAMGFLLTETDRRMRTYHLTNLRMLHLGGLWTRSGWTVHYDAVLDVDARQGPLARLLGYGTLEPVLQESRAVARPTRRRKVAVPAMSSDIDLDAAPRLQGVGRFAKVRHLVACFIQDATASEYLRAERQTARRVSEAIRAVGRANVLRR